MQLKLLLSWIQSYFLGFSPSCFPPPKYLYPNTLRKMLSDASASQGWRGEAMETEIQNSLFGKWEKNRKEDLTISHHLNPSCLYFFMYTLELCSLSHIGDAFVNLRTLQKAANKHLNCCFNQGKKSNISVALRISGVSCVFTTQGLMFL